jgi:MraZ protein
VLRLRGNSPATIDEKGRLKLPSGFKSALDAFFASQALNDSNANASADLQPSAPRFYLTSLDAKCGLLYPLPIWEEIEEKIYKLPSTLGARRAYLENSSYYGSVIEPDAQGRFVIQPILRASADLSGEIVILGQINHLMIWNRSAFERRIAAEPLTTAHLEQLAELGI